MLIFSEQGPKSINEVHFIILSYREYEKRRGMNEKIQDEAIA